MLFLQTVPSKTEEKLAKHTLFINSPWENKGNLLKIMVWQIVFVDGTQGKQSKTYSETLSLRTVPSKTEETYAKPIVLLSGLWKKK